MNTPTRTQPAIALVYLAGLWQGATLVSFPAGSALLKNSLALSDPQYGAIFLPQVALAVVGAVGGGALAQRLGLRRLLALALVANGLSQLLLATSLMITPAMGYSMLLAATAMLGLGFGISGAPLNSYPPAFFPRHRDAAVVALHTALGVGLAGGPLLADFLGRVSNWLFFPLFLMAGAFLLAALSFMVALPSAHAPGVISARGGATHPVRTSLFWLFAAIAVLYAFAEGTFSNWAIIYLAEVKQLSPTVAALALSVFWGALVGGRLLISVLIIYIASSKIWITLPILMMVAFLLLPNANSDFAGITLFALAGLACSAFFPLTIGLISSRFPHHVAWVSSMMIAALMIGVGLGTFIIGALRMELGMEQLYRISAGYPLAALVLAVIALNLPAPQQSSSDHPPITP